MKTSKRKRSSRSEPVAAALDVADAPAAEPAAEAEVVPTEAVVATESSAAAVDPVVVLAANCSVKDAAALKTSLCAVSNESAAVALDASAVERVDTATMQLLCAFVRDRSSRKQSVVWRGQSRALHDAVRLLGLGSLLGLDEAKGVAA